MRMLRRLFVHVTAEEILGLPRRSLIRLLVAAPESGVDVPNGRPRQGLDDQSGALADVERPVPSDNEVLVRIHATTVTRTDCHIRAAKPFLWRFFAGFLRPKRGVEKLRGRGLGRRPVRRRSRAGIAHRASSHKVRRFP